MAVIQYLILAVAGIAILVFLKQLTRRFSKKEDFEDLYRKVLLSDEHKVKGRFD
jgi:hypothetical protein